jgi:hypothetical protein
VPGGHDSQRFAPSWCVYNAFLIQRILNSDARFRAAGTLIPPVGVPPLTYKGRAVDVKQVARELGVRYVLEGSVRRAGNRVRITGQLIDTASGSHIWAI